MSNEQQPDQPQTPEEETTTASFEEEGTPAIGEGMPSEEEVVDAAEEVVDEEEVGTEAEVVETSVTVPPRSDYDPTIATDSITHHLSGMYQSWFLDYASYVILERAVPHIMDGLKPVQRRILHSMKQMDDGRYNKVANIVGHTMQFHPHGDASIKDALVQMGQKELLIDCQGNWGNILTGDDAAAGRYIEARLSKFALEVVFNPKTTEWKLSYDGRNKEPIALPVKFPLLLAQGAEGIAVGLSCKILPHNLGELCDAAVHYLYGEPFTLYPDFPTGGSIDVSRYADGGRGGRVRVRAKIEKRDSKTLAITEIPFGCTTGTAKRPSTFIESIKKAAEKGKIKVRKVEDMTAAGVEILIHLMPGVSADKTIDALYAFTDCETAISPNCCVIDERKPQFLTVSDVLRRSVDNTRQLIKREMEIRRDELTEQLHFASLERIFIEQRIYKGKPFEQAESMDAACAYVDERLTPFYPSMVREVTKDDILRLMEIKMARILKFNSDKAEELIVRLKEEIEQIGRDLANLTEVTAQWFRFLKKKYAEGHPRQTEIRNFDTIEATKVAEANSKLYINRSEGFIGTGLKKDELVTTCSDIDDVILFYRDGTYKVIRVADKVFVGETERSKAEKRKAEVIYIDVFKRGDQRTIYNVCYKDGPGGSTFIKRFNITGVTRDREYDVTQGTPKSRITYLSANHNGEAEVVRVTLKPQGRLKQLSFERDFREVPIKGRGVRGNLLTKYDVLRITMKSRGGSTLGGRKVWFDADVGRINFDEHGSYLGEFFPDDRILVILPDGRYYLTEVDTNNHYEPQLLRIEQYQAAKIWTAVLLDADNEGHPYLKRFTLEATAKQQTFLGEGGKNQLLLLTDAPHPLLQMEFAEPDAFRGPMEIDATDFVAVKSAKAKGKRLCTYTIDQITELLAEQPEAAHDAADAASTETQGEDQPETERLETDAANPAATQEGDADSSPDADSPLIDENGQYRLF